MIDALKVLIIDDEHIIVKGLENLYDWSLNGFQVVGRAFNGETGADIARRLKPDIILTDIRMPKISGLELISLLKKEMPDIEFIIISGYDDFSYCQEALRLGAFDYMLKPINYQLLHEKLVEVTKKISAMKEETEKKKELIEFANEGYMIKRGEFFRSLIHKSFSDMNNVELSCNQLNINSYGYFRIIVIKCEESDINKCINLITLGIKLKLCKVHNLDLSIFRDADSCVFVIWGLDNETLDTIDLKENIMSLLFEINSRIDIGIGDMVKLSDINLSYNKAMDLVSAQESVNSNQILRKLKNYINEHYNEDINLKMLSLICNMTPFYISRFFKDKTGKNYTEYLQEIRIGKARELLLKSDMSISEIAEKVGYSDYRVFIKMFKKCCDITPKQFKKKVEEKVHELNG